jgi:HD-GYP domain-containing protein (c-di-GMP phosphodiesterase class II)
LDKIKLNREDIVLGKPMPWNIYRSDGTVLLKKGLRITSEKNLDRLLQGELLRDADGDSANDQSAPTATEPKSTPQAEQPPAQKKPGNPFEWINQFALQLKQIYKNIENEKNDAVSQIHKISENIRKLDSAYHNQFLYAVHTYYPHNYSLMQPIYSALLCDITAATLDYDDQQRISLRAAALTANIGMYNYQDSLNNQVSPLTEAQREELQLHPYQSVQMLKSINVDDEAWLSAIAGHHERNDGSGYPAQITTNTIKNKSKIISLADSYLAMISRRSYCSIMPPKVALQNIYTSASDEDQSMYLAFIKSLGIFPPGTYVKLANKEIAIVTRQSEKSTLHCVVSSVCNEDNEKFNIPVERDTSEKEFSITEFHTPKEDIEIDPLTIWGYRK